MSGLSSTITIDLEDDEDDNEQQYVNGLKELTTSLLDFDVYYHRTHHFNDLQELCTFYNATNIYNSSLLKKK